MTTPDRLRVAIVEDNPRFRSTLERFVSELPQFSVAESYGRADRAIGTSSARSPPANRSRGIWR